MFVYEDNVKVIRNVESTLREFRTGCLVSCTCGDCEGRSLGLFLGHVSDMPEYVYVLWTSSD